MRPVRTGGELLDHGGVKAVLALLGALPVAILAAPLAEEIAFQTLPIRAAPAGACGD